MVSKQTEISHLQTANKQLHEELAEKDLLIADWLKTSQSWVRPSIHNSFRFQVNTNSDHVQKERLEKLEAENARLAEILDKHNIKY